jgi:hypothetical protein
MRACEKNTFAAFSSKARACVRFARKQNCEIVARRRIERRIDHSQMRGRSGSRTNLFGSKFLHRASGSTWIRRHVGFPRVRVFSHAKPRETVLKIGSLTWTAFSSLRRGEARHCERARARTRARANLEARADAAPARFRPERETRRVSRTPDARRATAKARASRPKDRERATDAMSAALAAAQNKADLHRVTTEERLFHSEYNVPPGHAAAPNEVRWALRGYLPPKHLRIDGYNYGIPEETEAVFVEYAPDIVKRESTSALMAGCFVHDSEPAEEGMEEGISVGTITMSTSTPRLLDREVFAAIFLFASRSIQTDAL